MFLLFACVFIVIIALFENFHFRR